MRPSVPAGTPAPAGTRWLALGELAGEAFPSLMRKVIAHAACALPRRVRPSVRRSA